MILTIDNFDTRGPLDYSEFLDADRLPAVTRKLNRPAEMRTWLVSGRDGFTVPKLGARVELRKQDASALFTGYLSRAPRQEALGWGEDGLLSRWLLEAMGEEYALDRRVLPARAPIVGRSGGDILKALAAELAPGMLNVDAVQAIETVAPFRVDPALSWSEHAAELGVLCRAVYRIHDGKLVFEPAGSHTIEIGEQTPGFDESVLALDQPHDIVNDVTVLGEQGPQRYVRDYIQANGGTYSFYLSENPFSHAAETLLLDDYTGPLAPAAWSVTDPGGVIAPQAGGLTVNGGTGNDGQTYLAMAQNLELGGAVLLEHGEVSLQAPSRGVIGGLYSGNISVAACLAGFSISPSGGASVIQALVNGNLVGPAITTASGHRYVLVTRFYCVEPFRTGQRFHSAQHPGGSGAGDSAIPADLNVVLEMRDVDPAAAASLLEMPTVLFDGTIANAPAFATYAVINAASLFCKVGYTQIQKSVSAEVRVFSGGSSVSNSKVVGQKIDGASCEILAGTDPQVVFYSYALPADNDLIRVSYRDTGVSAERLQNQAAIAALARPGDSGLRSAAVRLLSPQARTSEECSKAAATLLEDLCATPYSGQYQCWSDWLPDDAWPGENLAISLPSRSLTVQATIREVDIELVTLENELSRYTIKFANDAVQSQSFSLETAKKKPAVSYAARIPGPWIACLPNADVVARSSSAVVIDTGTPPPAGGGFEVRLEDAGWGADVDRNFLGRFTSQTFSVPKLAASQSYFLRMFDGGTPPGYSRFATLLHVEY